MADDKTLPNLDDWDNLPLDPDDSGWDDIPLPSAESRPPAGAAVEISAEAEPAESQGGDAPPQIGGDANASAGKEILSAPPAKNSVAADRQVSAAPKPNKAAAEPELPVHIALTSSPAKTPPPVQDDDFGDLGNVSLDDLDLQMEDNGPAGPPDDDFDAPSAPHEAGSSPQIGDDAEAPAIVDDIDIIIEDPVASPQAGDDSNDDSILKSFDAHLSDAAYQGGSAPPQINGDSTIAAGNALDGPLAADAPPPADFAPGFGPAASPASPPESAGVAAEDFNSAVPPRPAAASGLQADEPPADLPDGLGGDAPPQIGGGANISAGKELDSPPAAPAAAPAVSAPAAGAEPRKDELAENDSAAGNSKGAISDRLAEEVESISSQKVELDIEGIFLNNEAKDDSVAAPVEEESEEEDAAEPEAPPEPIEEAPLPLPEPAPLGRLGRLKFFLKNAPKKKLLIIVLPVLLIFFGLIFGVYKLFFSSAGSDVPPETAVGIDSAVPPREPEPGALDLGAFYLSFPASDGETIVEMTVVLHYLDSPDREALEANMTRVRDVIFRAARAKGGRVVADGEIQSALRDELVAKIGEAAGRPQAVEYVQIVRFRILR